MKTLISNVRSITEQPTHKEESMYKRIAVVFILTVAAFGLALAQKQQRPKQERADGAEAIVRKLNLSESQELQMKKLRIELMKKQTQLRARIETLRLDNKELFLAEKIDRKAIEANVKSVSDVQEQMKLNFVDHWFSVNSMLNADQQKIWKKHAMDMGNQIRRGNARGQQMRMRMEENHFGRDNDVK
jgi:hypothetical protein